VGHSFGGIPLSVAMEKFPNKISVAVFVTALVLSENLNFTSFNQEVLSFVFFSHLIYIYMMSHLISKGEFSEF